MKKLILVMAFLSISTASFASDAYQTTRYISTQLVKATPCSYLPTYEVDELGHDGIYRTLFATAAIPVNNCLILENYLVKDGFFSNKPKEIPGSSKRVAKIMGESRVVKVKKTFRLNQEYESDHATTRKFKKELEEKVKGECLKTYATTLEEVINVQNTECAKY